MKRMLLVTVMIFMPFTSHAKSIDVDGTRVSIGDHMSKIWDRWGSEQYRVTSDKTCHPYKKDLCSYSRLVWKRGQRYIMIQEIRSTIINIKTTRNESDIRKAF